MRKSLLLLFTLSYLALAVYQASASGPLFWRINTRAEIEKGDAKGVAIADNGTLTLAPQFAERCRLSAGCKPGLGLRYPTNSRLAMQKNGIRAPLCTGRALS